MFSSFLKFGEIIVLLILEVTTMNELTIDQLIIFYKPNKNSEK
jgi:hypothetical protein